MLQTIGAVFDAWWAWLLVALLAGGASALMAMVSLSASTAYGTEYHSMSPAQRAMARVLYLGALAAAAVCGMAGFAFAAWSVRLLLG